VDSLGGGGGGGGEAEPGLVKSSLTNHHRLVVFSLLSFFCKGDPHPENGAQRRLGAEDLLCMG
jgi:hypothetical protein